MTTDTQEFCWEQQVTCVFISRGNAGSSQTETVLLSDIGMPDVDIWIQQVRTLLPQAGRYRDCLDCYASEINQQQALAGFQSTFPSQ